MWLVSRQVDAPERNSHHMSRLLVNDFPENQFSFTELGQVSNKAWYLEKVSAHVRVLFGAFGEALVEGGKRKKIGRVRIDCVLRLRILNLILVGSRGIEG